MAAAFSFGTAARIVFGPGSLSSVRAALPAAARSALVVTDVGVAETGAVGVAAEALRAGGMDAAVFDGVVADPPVAVVEAAVAAARACRADAVVGVGGGSSMDVAKLVAVLARDGAPALESIYGVDQCPSERLGLVQVPTTAGTGSEVTPISIITTGGNEKKGVVAPVLLPDAAVVDPLLTLGVPPPVTASTGIDAMVHAIEAYTTKTKKNPLSDVIALKGLALLASNIEAAYTDGNNLEARSGMLLGSTLAGMAFANAPVAAVHALAYPLGGHFGVAHGLSNSLMLPHVLRFTAEDPGAKQLYRELAHIMHAATRPLGDGAVAKPMAPLVDQLEALIDVLELPKTLREVGVREGDLAMLAEDAIKQQRLLVNNRRRVELGDALKMYEMAY